MQLFSLSNILTCIHDGILSVAVYMYLMVVCLHVDAVFLCGCCLTCKLSDMYLFAEQYQV